MFADPARCPSCSAAMAGTGVCATCGVSFTSPEARELWAVLNRADTLLAQMREAAAEPAASPPKAPRLPRRPTRSLSTGSIILALGALCLVVAAFIFITVSWDSLGLLGRTLVLLGITAVVGTIAAVVTLRTLRGSAEALWAILAGFVTLDYFAAREYGLLGLDGLRFSHALLLFGLLFMAIGVGVSVWAKRRVGMPIVVTQIIAILGSYAACAGVDIPGLRGAYVALAALADHPAQRSARGRHDNPGNQCGKESAQFDCKPQVPGQKPGRMTCDVAQIASRDAGVFRANDAVDEGDGEIESLRVFQQSGQSCSGWIGMSFVGRGLVEPALNKGDCLVCQG